MSFVLDASVALSWCFEDEASPSAWDLLDRLEKEKVSAPSLWPLEITNILVLAARKKRISYAHLTQLLEYMSRLPIHIDEETTQRTFKEISYLAHSEKITTYDASYLELAMRLGAPLATKDKVLAQAAKHLGIHLL